MTKRIVLASLSTAAVLFLSFAASAQTHNIRSTLALSDRVEIPGAVLEPGTYLVRVAEQQSDRNTIVFQSLDGTRTFATVLATPHPKARSIDETEFVYFPTPAGEPRVLRTWFPPNDRFAGQDFVYPADRMAALRKETSEELPVATAQTTPMPAPAEKADMVPVTPPPPPASAPAAEPRPEPPTRIADAGSTLPKTASPVPAIGSLGLLFLAAGSLLRRKAV